MVAQASETLSPRKTRHSRWFWVGIGALAVGVILFVAGDLLLSRATPILRARLVASLSARFHGRVVVGPFHVSLLHGFEVSGQDLAIYPENDISPLPLFSVGHFTFRTGYRSLFASPMRVGQVEVDGLRINVPPRSQRRPASPTNSPRQGKAPTIFVDQMNCTDTVLTLGTDKPGKQPLQFVIQTLNLRSIGAGKPMDFTAVLTNPKPRGHIESRGFFGPWNADHPAATVLGGTYSFTHADLSGFKGIGGILSSQGGYQGTLDRIVVDGKTDTPDFEVKISGHKVALHTEFHAIVDGIDGNTYLQPVKAHFLHSFMVARGYVVRVPGEPGRHTYLDVAIDQARIEDLLRLAVRTEPPVMEGRVVLHTTLDLPPNREDVVHRLRLHGKFVIANARFSNEKLQTRVDELSLRGQGRPDLVANKQLPDVRSQLAGDFTLADASLDLSRVRYDVPGANIKLDGVYTLDGAKFNFTGTADMKATLSRMVGGWRGLFLMPIDRYFAKNGAGAEVPFTLDGTRSNPHFGLDLGRRAAPQVKPRIPVGVGVGPVR